ncbi:MAG TPA: WG repeat-containing protein [Chryseolinea sp.]|nr:WG repeat-containing protein [Chryseolinea sp.]
MRISVAIVAVLILFSCKTNQLAVVKLNDKYGCIDRKGKFVIEPTWDYILPGRKNKQILVMKDSLYSYIDRRGNQIIKQRYKEAMIFYEGYAFIGDGKKYGFINVKGDTIAPLIYDYVFFGFSNGLSDVTRNDSCGYIDKKGKLAIPCVYKMCYKFSSGVARVTTFEDSTILINKKGEVVARNGDKYRKKVWAPLGPDPLEIQTARGEGRINEKGDTLIPPIHTYVDEFIERRAIVNLENLYGVYDDRGNVILSPGFDYIRRFSEGLASFELHNKWGYITKKGRIAIEPTFENAKEFSNGLAYVLVDGKVGYINRKGKLLITPRFEKNGSNSSQFK